MIEIEVSRASAETLAEQLAALRGAKVYGAIKSAAKRAASHAKRIGTKHVRSMYTIDAASIKAATSIYGTQDGAMLRIAGPRKGVDHYKAKKRKQGVFVSIKKGSGDIVPRSFAYSGTFFQREGKERLPIKRLFGPAVPQLFGNDAIKGEIAAEAMKKYEERLRHEIGRLIGG